MAVAFIILADTGPARVAPASAGGGTGGFVSDVVVAGFSFPTAFAFAPDGRIFVATHSGAIQVVKDGALLPTPFLELPANTYFDHGVLGFGLDPNFATNGFVYVYYTYENDPSNFQGPKTGRLIRVTADGDVALPGSELVLLGSVVGDPSQPSCTDFPDGTDCLPADGCSHYGGALRFASDGTLFFATGDAAHPCTPDYQQLIVRTQNLDNLAGKILRINADGTAPADNPFYNGDPAANRSKVWAYGLRNPFRLGLQPGTDLPFVGDVGESRWEEIDIAGRGANLGWPCYEGAAAHPTYSALTTCQDLYASGDPVTHPLYAYANSGGATVVGGVFYQGSSYPAELQNAFFFGDWARGTISALKVDAGNQLVPDSVQTVLTGSGQPVNLEIGPDGDVYYLTLDPPNYTGELRHLRFIPGNRPPVAHAAGAPQGGLAPLSIQFSSAGSIDPDGDSLSYAWDFGDNQASSQPNPEHTYDENGTYLVTLTVSDPALAEGTAQVSVIVGNQPPQAVLTEPAPDFAYEDNQVVTFSGTGTDPETGTVPSWSRSWTVLLYHCYPATVTCHKHPFLTKTGSSGTLITPPSDGDFVFLELILTVTDGVGLTGSTSIMIGPDTDGDGLRDFTELLTYGTDYLNPDTDGDGCTESQELGPDEKLGGRRDPTNPWDYFNPTGDLQNRVDDILAVVYHFGEGLGDPGYSTAYDRTGVGPDPWNLGPPDGLIRVGDILAIVQQYQHDCG